MLRRKKEKTKLAVFDFDGTCISGSSTVALVVYMGKRKMIGPTVILRIVGWSLCYVCHLPQNESWVRGLVFAAFEGWPVEKVDCFLRDFYDSEVEKRWRPQAIGTMHSLKEAGYQIVLVSATFDQIASRAMEDKPIDYQISTRMRKALDGTYAREVDGNPVEGPEKLSALKRFADSKYGKGNWELGYCFGDHYSDLAVLSSAEHPQAVMPDKTLERHARRHNWGIHLWGQDDVPALKISL